MADTTDEQAFNAVELATELTIAWLGNPNVNVSADDVPAFLRSMHATIGELSKKGESKDAAQEYVPAVPVRSSVKPDYIVSLIDGRKLKSLKRHLATHGLTPKEYRERYGLKPDYPMVAPNYAEQRRAVAQKIGLGRKGRGTAAASASAANGAAPKPSPEQASKPATNPAVEKKVPAAAKPAAARPAVEKKPAPEKKPVAAKKPATDKAGAPRKAKAPTAAKPAPAASSASVPASSPAPAKRGRPKKALATA